MPQSTYGPQGLGYRRLCFATANSQFNSINIHLFSEHQSIPTDNNAVGIYRENGDIARLKIVR